MKQEWKSFRMLKIIESMRVHGDLLKSSLLHMFEIFYIKNQKNLSFGPKTKQKKSV